MTELKQEIIALFESIPDERVDLLEKILRNICGQLDHKSKRHDKLISRAEQNLAVMEEAENLLGEGGDSKDG